MPMVAQQAPYTLLILDDEHPHSPREDVDNFGTMVCFHSRYNLGDDHTHDEPREFLQDVLFGRYAACPTSKYGKPIFDYIKQGNAQGLRMEYNRSVREWELLEINSWSSNDQWHTISSYPANLKGKDVPDWFLEDCLSLLRINELKELVGKIEGMVMLPLYLYDHSGITMNTHPFSCQWDSGQVGWIYADSEAIIKNYGAVTPETIKQSENLLAAEVKEYDYFLTGQSYGFKLYEGDDVIDSCWGFSGEINDVAKYIQAHLPDECKTIVDSLEFHYDIDEDSLLAQTHEAEGENDEDIEI